MKKQNGFTLLELLVTFAIAAIVLTIAMPNYNEFIMNNRIVAQVNQFVADTNLARSAAIKYQRGASICVSTSYATSTPACTSGTDWSEGWIVWVDRNQNANTDAGEVLKVNGPLSGSTTFTSASRNSFSYDALGFINANESLSMCDDRAGELGRQVAISPSGRPEVQTLTCS